jgi:ribosomal protein S3AE
MPLDVNKIIMESLEAINDNTTKEEVVTETATEEKKEEVVNETEEIDPMLNARVAAFAAGLGAVTLRKKLASYN